MPKGAIVSLIDIGVKFPQRYYNKNTDIRRYLARAAAAGVSHMIIIGSDYTTSQEALRICKEFDGCAGVILRCTVGIHPHNATQTFEKRVRKEVYEAQLRDEKHDLERGKRLGNLLRNTKVIRYETTKVNPTGKGIKSTNGSNSSDTPAEPTNGSNGGQSEANGNGTPAPQTVDQEWVILEAKYAKTFHTSLEKLITSPEGQKYCVAIGEIGLDYKAKSSAPDPLHQKQVFRKLLPLASKHNLPLYLHNRDAHSDFLSILKPFLSSTKAVVHCHTDPSLKNLKELLAGDCGG
jgi:Tat protein secretion system quality control protein TatD with DNase activity